MNTEKKLIPIRRFPDFKNSEEWSERSFGDCLDYEQPQPYLVHSDSYKKSGIPVLTAGKTFILGYTDEATGIYNNIPVIIFDDFTTASKFVDFPFKAKSSAMKMLKNRSGYDLRFMFEAIQNYEFEPKDHQRHWISIFSRFKTLVPSYSEQQKIADCISSIDSCIASINEKIEKLKAHKKGLMQKLFPQNGRIVPEYRFPEFESAGEWKEYSMEDIFEIKNGYTPSKSNPQFWEDGTIPWFRMEDIRKNGHILSDAIQHITPNAVKGKGLFPAYSIILATSATIGEHALIIVDSLANQQFTFLTKRESFDCKLDMLYFHYYMFIIDEWCKRNTNSGGLLSVNMSAFKQLMIPFPQLNEQKKIAKCLFSIDKIINHSSKKKYLIEQHKKGLQQQLFPVSK